MYFRALDEERLKRDDVFNNVRMAQALENENEPSWKEVRMMKDILGGCSPNSPEAIELNLTRYLSLFKGQSVSRTINCELQQNIQVSGKLIKSLKFLQFGSNF